MQKAYKVLLTLKTTYSVDALAENEEQAIELAKIEFAKQQESGTAHYFVLGDEDELETDAIDVSGTDDDPREQK